MEEAHDSSDFVEMRYFCLQGDLFHTFPPSRLHVGGEPSLAIVHIGSVLIQLGHRISGAQMLLAVLGIIVPPLEAHQTPGCRACDLEGQWAARSFWPELGTTSKEGALIPEVCWGAGNA